MKHESRINRLSHFIISTLALFAFSTFVFGASTELSAYKKKIYNTKESLDILLNLDNEYTTRTENTNYERSVLTHIRANLPATERVSWKGSEIETENAWVLERLQLFEKENDLVKRRAILIELSERLGAINAKVDELERAIANDRTKDQDKQKLAEILRRAEYQKPEPKKESFLQRKWREFKEWLNKKSPERNTGTPQIGGLQSFSVVLQILVYAAVLGIIGFLIYRFAPFLRQRFKNRVKKDKGARVILGETLAADETSQNLFAEAEKLAREGNLRGAIRKGYIAFLCELADRKVIGLARHKTNRDYLRDVRNLNDLHRDMKGLTGSFERCWYGFAAPGEKEWEEFKEGYKKAVKS